MVQVVTLFKKRRGSDRNNFDFVMEPFPRGTDPETGYPLYREITDVTFRHQDYTDTYLKVNSTDDYGMYTEFLVRPGVRKFRQDHVQLTVEQKGTTFEEPAFLISFFGTRIGDYNLDTGKFSAIYKYFNLTRNTSMLCQNSEIEMRGLDPTHIQTLLNEADICPLTMYTLDYDDEHIVPPNLNEMWTDNFISGVNTRLAYNQEADAIHYDEISQSAAVIIEDGFPGMSIAPGTYEISLWEELTPGYGSYTIPMDTSSYPQGWVQSITTWLGEDGFTFAADAATVIALGSITITNMPAATNANGTFTPVAHTLPGLVRLVERPHQGVVYSHETLIDLLKTEKGITEDLFKFYKPVVYKNYPAQDFVNIGPLMHTSTVTVSNKTFTSHTLMSPILNHTIDSSSFSSDFAIEVKLVSYVAIVQYKSSATSDKEPVLTLLPSDNIISFSATLNLI
jgi:hypothetical protein